MKNFEHSRDQVTSRMALVVHSVTELTGYHGIFILLKSRVYSKHRSPISTFFGAMENGIICPCLGKGKFFANSNLTNLVDLQCLRENGK